MVCLIHKKEVQGADGRRFGEALNALLAAPIGTCKVKFVASVAPRNNC